MFKSYAVLITITSYGINPNINYFYDSLVTARTYKEACKIANKLAQAAYKKHNTKFSNGRVTEIKILEA